MRITTDSEIKNEDQIQVIIIGSGMAGVTTANTIQEQLKNSQKKVNIIILEGRDRIGGRTYSKKLTQNNIPIDLGASWIQGPNCREVKKLCSQLELETVKKDWKSLYFSSNGNLLTEKYVNGEHKKYENIIAQAVRMPEKDIPLKQCLDIYRKKANLKIKDEELFYGYLRDLELYEGGSVHELSSWELDDSDDSSTDEEEEILDADVMVKEGYGNLVETYAKGLNILLSHTVKSIDYTDPSLIKVKTDRGDFFGHYVVSTIPLGCLQKETVEFKPSLPKQKKDVINKIGMGLLNKVILEFPNNFWGDEIEWVHKNSKIDEPDFFQFLSLDYVVPGSNTLMAFCETDLARKVETMKESDVIKQAMNVLRSIFGNNIPDPLSCYITKWNSDPFSYGSYSFEKSGSTGKDRDLLGKPIEDRLFFAGEACINVGGTYAVGAHLSGKRDGSKIAKLILKRK
jgi:monoamine oxidase